MAIPAVRLINHSFNRVAAHLVVDAEVRVGTQWYDVMVYVYFSPFQSMDVVQPLQFLKSWVS